MVDDDLYLDFELQGDTEIDVPKFMENNIYENLKISLPQKSRSKFIRLCNLLSCFPEEIPKFCSSTTFDIVVQTNSCQSTQSLIYWTMYL